MEAQFSLKVREEKLFIFLASYKRILQILLFSDHLNMMKFLLKFSSKNLSGRFID